MKLLAAKDSRRQELAGKEPCLLPPSPPSSDDRLSYPSATVHIAHNADTNFNAYADVISTVDIAAHNLRRDYDWDNSEHRPLYKSRSANGRLIFVMPSDVHEAVRIGVERILERQLQDWQVEPMGSATIKLHDCHARAQQPDAQFIHKTQLVPGLVIEIAYLQSIKDAVKHAKNYIYGTYGKIRSAILISIKSPPEESVLSHWRAAFYTSAGETCMRIDEVFRKAYRASDGTMANKDSFLTIPLSDFRINSEAIATVRCADVFDLATAAEAQQSRKRQLEREPGTPERRIKREPLFSSSPEQLRDEHEAAFKRAETLAESSTELQSNYIEPKSKQAIHPRSGSSSNQDGLSSRLRLR